MAQDAVRSAINSSLYLRWLLILAWLNCMFGILFAILPLVVNDAPGGMPVIVFNVSSLGVADYTNDYLDSELKTNLSALVDPPITNPASLTKYMGIHDWYTISYLWICKGWYEKSNGTLGRMVNSTCERREPLYNGTVSLRELLQAEIDPSIKYYAEYIRLVEYDPDLWFGLWLSGICFAGVVFLALPFTFDRRKLLGLRAWCLIPITLALVPFSIFIATLSIIKQAGSENAPEDKWQGAIPDRFRHICNLAIVCMISTFITGVLGWTVGRWLKDSFPTPKKEMAEPEQYIDDRPVAQNDGLNEIEPEPFYDRLRSQPSQPESSIPSPPPSPMGLDRMLPTPIPEEQATIPDIELLEARRKDAHSM